ncbi:MAG: DUF3842 family protein [Desulfobacterales bacterium]|nr:DUF3842 family protein [Desulfobacterales bacterium]MCP4163825.1 DUF3842 family protein [Deltaproteobacteria bacterium]
MKKICVIDGQGGGIGSNIIKKLKEEFGEKVEVIALGTNAIATAQMLKSKANKGASGENAIIHSVRDADVIVGPLSIIMPHSFMGEFTVGMAEAVSKASARKFLIPLFQENLEIAGMSSSPLPHFVDDIVIKNIKPYIMRKD